MKFIYVVENDERETIDPIGIFDRKGLSEYLRDFRRKYWVYTTDTVIDGSGSVKKYRHKVLMKRIRVIRHPLNSLCPGLILTERCITRF